MFKKIKELTVPALLAIGVFALARMALAADPGVITNGSGTSYAQFIEIDAGTVNFSPGGASISVGSSVLTGYAWGDYVGWINMNPTNGGVANDGSGNLSGYAWGEITGFINFNPTNGGVTIDTSTGEFAGHAWTENFGWLKFECPGTACVVTDWRPSSTTTEEPSGGGGSVSRTTDEEETTPTVDEIIVPVAIPITPTTGEQTKIDNIYSPEQPRAFSRNLRFGMVGNDIQVLQEFLIRGGYLESGFNTGYFGKLTENAVIGYQNAKGITPAVGFFGPITRSSVENEMIIIANVLNRPVPQQTQPVTIEPVPSPAPSIPFGPLAPIFPIAKDTVVSIYSNNLFGFPDVISTVAQIGSQKIESPAEQVTPLVRVVPRFFQAVTNAISSFFGSWGR